jgi:excisionase family DNA binding protein
MDSNEIPRSFYWNNNRLLEPKDVAALIKLSLKTVHRLAREGKLACVQVTARERRFTLEQVQQYIDSRSTHVVVDKKDSRPVSSPHKKGGEKSRFVGVSGKDLRKEMKKWR